MNTEWKQTLSAPTTTARISLLFSVIMYSEGNSSKIFLLVLLLGNLSEEFLDPAVLGMHLESSFAIDS